MISFANPWAFLLVPISALVLWRWRRQGHGSLRYSSTLLVAGLPTGRGPLARRAGLLLRGAALFLLVVALAGPCWPDETTRIPTEGVSIALVLDVSGSMAEEDFDWNGAKIARLEGVKRALRLFVAGGEAPGEVTLPGRPNDLSALVTFAAHPETACPLTLDHAALLRILEVQVPRTASAQASTNPGDALAWALYVLKNAPTRRKVIVLLTDGESNVPLGLKPRQAAQLAGNFRVPIYALDASPAASEAADAADVALARESLKTIAAMTGGVSLRAQDGPALAEALRRIGDLERDRIESFQYRRYHEAFAWCALAALACWTAVVVLESTVWRTVP